jgi:putative transcriptional regulator
VKKRDIGKELLQSIAEFREFDAGRLKLRTRTYKVKEPDLIAIRKKAKVSQQTFAALIGVSLRTLQNWEQGHRRPTGPARALLTIVQANPAAAIRALHAQVVRLA